MLRKIQSLRSVYNPPPLRQKGALPTAGDSRAACVLDLVPLPRFFPAELERKGYVSCRQLCRRRSSARSVLSQPLLFQRLRWPAAGERLVRETDDGDP